MELNNIKIPRLFIPALLISVQPIIAATTEQRKDSLKNIFLDEVVVKTSGGEKYNTTTLSNDFRLTGEVIEVPQVIQILDANILKDQFVLNVNESVTRNVSGAFREELHNGISPDIYCRGGYINPQRNGVDLRPILKGPLADDISVIECVEFVKGPSVYMNSLGDAAGSYNIITKKPTGYKKNTVKLIQGSFNLLRAEADLDGFLDKKGKLLYRANIMASHKKGFLKYDDNNRIVIAPSLTYNIDDNTSITAQYIYQHMNYKMLSEAQISPYGFGTLPKDFTMTDPASRPYEADNNDAFVSFQKRFNPNWDMKAQVSNVNCNSKGAIFWVYGKNEEDPDILDRYYVYDAMKYNTFSAQSYVRGKINSGFIKQNLLGGFDFNHKNNKTHDTWETASTIYPLSISNPVYAHVINNNGIGGDFDSENIIDDEINITDSWLYYFSVYVMDELSMFNEKLKVNVGVRYSFAKSHFNQYGDKSKSKDNIVTPRVGINYMILPSFYVYGLYDNTFIPIAGVNSDGGGLKPLKGTSYEAGIKKEWFNKALTTSASYYHIRRKNNVITDPVTNQIYQMGENKSKGFEIDIRGKICKGLNIIANYAYTDSKITKNKYNPEYIGKATPNTIKNIQNTWLEYTFPSKTLNALSINLGYQYMGGRTERFTSVEPVKMKNIFRMDGGVSFVKKKYGLHVLVSNILNSKQYSTAWKKNDMYYWVQLPPVNYRCSLEVYF